jgi:3'-phosphoadenosine 5'-phosphosulfate sulfotransferase (PAPS reductase)/FAD synthetase
VANKRGWYPARIQYVPPRIFNVIEEGFTAAFGGGRRSEEKARAKERVYSHP